MPYFKKKCCCGELTFVCGSTETCKDWSNPNFKAFERSLLCNCPCPDRDGNLVLGYPTCWQTQIRDLSLRLSTLIKFELGAPPFDQLAYIKINSCPSINLNVFFQDDVPVCDDAPLRLPSFAVGGVDYTVYDSDGVTVIDSQPDGRLEFLEVNPYIGFCGDSIINGVTQIGFRVSCKLINDPNYNPSASPQPAVFSLPVMYMNLESPDFLDRCVDGNLLLHGTEIGDDSLDGINDSPGNTRRDDHLYDNPGKVYYYPTHLAGTSGASLYDDPVDPRDPCPAEPCIHSEDPASICAKTSTIAIAIWDDDLADYVLYIVDLVQAIDGHWEGTDGIVDITISEYDSADPADKCCPTLDPLNCTDCSPSSPTGESGSSPKCDRCYVVNIEKDHGDETCRIKYYLRGSCPPNELFGTGMLTSISNSVEGCGDHVPIVNDASLSYGTDCP